MLEEGLQTRPVRPRALERRRRRVCSKGGRPGGEAIESVPWAGQEKLEGEAVPGGKSPFPRGRLGNAGL